jgi:cytochrome c oxidase subunit 2
MGFKRVILAGSGAAIAALAAADAAFAANGPKDKAIGFQEGVTPVMENLISFHNVYLMPIITGITLFVLVLMGYIMWRFSEKRNPVPSKTTHHVGLEVAWTIIPVIILLIMVVPSMRLLYFQDVIPESDMTIKVTGNTWNWEYAYPDHPEVESFISNVLEEADAKAAGKPYLLGSDAPLVVPVDTTVRVIVTSSNNLHSFAVPAFGIKMDAVPGRLNETWFKVNPGKEGTYFGQCSELCGVRHAYMPIEVQVVGKDEFRQWAANGGAFATSTAEKLETQLPVTAGAATAAAPK